MKILLIFGFICQLAYSAKHYPDYLKPHPCKGSDSDYSGCLKKHLQSVLPFFVKGVPELDSPPLDPLIISEYDRNISVHGVADLELKFKDIEVTGIRNLIFDNVKIDMEKQSNAVSITIPWLSIKLLYDITGNVLSVPVAFSGSFSGNITTIQVKLKYNFRTYKKDGEDHLEVGKLNLKVSIGGGKINLETTSEELQPKLLVQMVQEYFNENPRESFEQIQPFVIQEGEDTLTKIFNEFFAGIPISELVPN